MRIGILTFHSQLNYGGVLQCWALKKALEGMGHEVVVVDRWLDPENRALYGFMKSGLGGLVKHFIRGILGCGDFARMVRIVRTVRFVRGLGLTHVHFVKWSELSLDDDEIRDIEMLVIGSDQVWRFAERCDPSAYLLEGAPRIKAISYAASFGMTKIPGQMIEFYKANLMRFSSISCREHEGVELCRTLGFSATHVVDPTLLLLPRMWDELSARAGDTKSRRKLVCYFIEPDAIMSSLSDLDSFARKMNCDVEVLTDSLRPLPRTVSQLFANFKVGRVKVCRGCGPADFVRAFSSASWTLTDSFHAVMFSVIFNRNARFLRPTGASTRAGMFARIEEFVKSCARGPIFTDSVHAALQSICQGEWVTFDNAWISARREASKKWLLKALESGRR